MPVRAGDRGGATARALPRARGPKRARESFSSEGVPRAQLEPCAIEGRDGTQLAGRVKLYLPLDAGEQPFRMLFTPGVIGDQLDLDYLAFGVGHQPRGSHARSVYEIAHYRVHGRWPRRSQ